MEQLKQITIVALAVAVSLMCFAGVMSIEQATAQNVQAIYLDLHNGNR